ncbi:hypothetical protein NOF04DRAFT_13886 [Fusarium oxysporum II5]|uniref:Zn(2)-C6 fungal-type domain-containing protein n=2 Tax=Fusarium oxysporum species complex TaxID=171631 RepID=X0IWH4_FUSO5|nr:uncharacterized protein FOIG_13716 [Fusarium odoratissimum NRRL 54006]EXL93303.1 hypothetical protein FOIG_13716 [Fusarium odoratissimum NRRL 54006]KAK2134502.1 hypothetical protein NOF04DRAFT_13886 [Fusarium oxysporum II5]
MVRLYSHAPAPARVNKTDITRSRNGCARCRSKRRKCDEKRPFCSRCVSAGIDCEYTSMALKFREATQWAADKVDHRIASVSSKGRRCSRQVRSSPPNGTPPTHVHPQQPSLAVDTSCNEQSQSHSPPLQTASRLTEQQCDNTIMAATDSTTNNNSGAWEPVLYNQSLELGNSDANTDYFDFDMGMVQLGCPDSDFINDLVGIQFNMDDISMAQLPWEPPISQPEQPLREPQTEESREKRAVTATATLPQVQQITPGLAIDQHSTPSPSPMINQCQLPSPDDSQTCHSAASIGSIHLSRPTQPSTIKIVHGDRLYLAHFRITIVKAFPVQPTYLWSLVLKCKPLYCAALALAAANLANLHGRHSNDGTWIPMPTHFNKATVFLEQSKASLESSSAASPPLQARLITMFLMEYYELECGSISSVWQTLSVLDNAFLTQQDIILSLPESDILFQWWLHLRSFATWPRVPYHVCVAEHPTGSLIRSLETRFLTASQMINVVGTKAEHIWWRILIVKCFGNSGETTPQVLNTFKDWFAILKGNLVEHGDQIPVTFMDDTETHDELKELRTTLLSCVPPEDFHSDLLAECQGQDTDSSYNLEPLVLSSHGRAMEMAEYAFAQILCDSGLLRRLLDPTTNNKRQFPKQESMVAEKHHSWARLIARIALGLDLSRCAKENNFRRGILHFLFCAGLMIPGSLSYDLIEHIVKGLMDTHAKSEGPFYPLHGFMPFIQTIRQESRKGRTIFLACMTHDEWASKDSLFSTAAGAHMIAFGREDNGQYFGDLVPIAEVPTLQL